MWRLSVVRVWSECSVGGDEGEVVQFLLITRASERATRISISQLIFQEYVGDADA